MCFCRPRYGQARPTATPTTFFTAYEQTTDPEEKLRIVAKIVEELSIHVHIEEKVLYPLVRSKLDDGQELFEHSLEEHQEAKQVLAQIEKTAVSDARFDTRVQELTQEVRHHVEEEESDMLPPSGPRRRGPVDGPARNLLEEGLDRAAGVDVVSGRAPRRLRREEQAGP